jgi:SAM-dependent MidA family methyltransferase
MTQAQFLQQWGIEELVLEGKEYWENLSSAPYVAAIKMRSRATEAQSLLASGGLGGFNALEWSK